MGTSYLSHRAQLAATAVSTALLTISSLYAYDQYQRYSRRKNLNEDVLRSVVNESSGTLTRPGSPVHPSGEKTDLDDDEFVREQLARNYAFLGEESMAQVLDTKVAVVGLGGVGSWCSVMLVRSGISKIRLIDFDQVSLSSLNRHATAMREDVGRPKVDCVARTLRAIRQGVQVECIRETWRLEEGGAKLLKGVDWVVDAIDNISTKVDLLKYCHQNNIKVISSMGAGAKCDPTRIQIADISSTIYDPLARSVRRLLRLSGVSNGIPVVYSTEVPGDVKLLPLPEEEFQKGAVNELGAFDDFRIRILPVLGPLPAIFGLNIATYIICEAAGKPILNPLPVKNRRKVYEKLYRDLLTRENRLSDQPLNKLPIDEDDVGYLFEDLFRGRSVLPPHDVPNKPALVRWDLSRPVSLENCVVMDLKDAEKHVRTPLWGEESQTIVDRVSSELSRFKKWMS